MGRVGAALGWALGCVALGRAAGKHTISLYLDPLKHVKQIWTNAPAVSARRNEQMLENCSPTPEGPRDGSQEAGRHREPQASFSDEHRYRERRSGTRSSTPGDFRSQMFELLLLLLLLFMFWVCPLLFLLLFFVCGGGGEE